MLYVDVIDQSPRIVICFLNFSFRENLYDHNFSFSLAGDSRDLPQDMPSLFMGNKQLWNLFPYLSMRELQGLGL